ncbi:MAG: HEAT repeat domain-containing protein [Armatimonadetes bacterium]|nr:HEAT repeat domain-containing protein [Armatimonadota bacterium]
MSDDEFAELSGHFVYDRYCVDVESYGGWKRGEMGRDLAFARQGGGASAVEHWVVQAKRWTADYSPARLKRLIADEWGKFKRNGIQCTDWLLIASHPLDSVRDWLRDEGRKRGLRVTAVDVAQLEQWLYKERHDLRREFFRMPVERHSWASLMAVCGKALKDQLAVLGRRYDPDQYVSRAALQARFSDFLQGGGRPLFLLVGPAKHGKTTLTCHLAEATSRQAAVVLVHANSQIPQRDGLEALVSTLLGYGEQPSENYVRDVRDVLRVVKQNGRQFLVFVDGVDECDPAGWAQAIQQFVVRFREEPIKVLITCRDISWQLASPHLLDHDSLVYLGPDEPFHAIGRFSDEERSSAAARNGVDEAALPPHIIEVLGHPFAWQLFLSLSRDARRTLLDDPAAGLLGLLDLFWHAQIKDASIRLGLRIDQEALERTLVVVAGEVVRRRSHLLTREWLGNLDFPWPGAKDQLVDGSPSSAFTQLVDCGLLRRGEGGGLGLADEVEELAVGRHIISELEAQTAGADEAYQYTHGLVERTYPFSPVLGGMALAIQLLLRSGKVATAEGIMGLFLDTHLIPSTIFGYVGDGAVAYLSRLIEASDPRAWCARAGLSAVGSTAAIEKFVQMLSSQDRTVQEHAVWGLGDIRHPASAAALVPMFGGAASEVGSQASEQLSSAPSIHYSVHKALCRVGAPGIDAVVQGLYDENAEVREGCADVLGALADRETTPHLREHEKASRGKPREHAAVLWALGSVRDAESEAAIVEVLNTSAEGVELRAAAVAAGRIRSRGAVPGLLRLVRDRLLPSWYEQNEAINALVTIGGEDGIQDLCALLAEDLDGPTRRFGEREWAWYCARVRTRSGLCLLLRAIGTPSAWGSDGWRRRESIEELSKTADPALLGALRSLTDEEPDLWRRAEEQLVRVCRRQTGSTEGRTGWESHERQHAATALVKMHSNLSVEALSAIVGSPLSEDLYAREWACEELGLLAEVSAEPALLAALQTGDQRTRRAAAVALGTCGGQAALSSLLGLSAVEDDDLVRGGIGEALPAVAIRLDQVTTLLQHLPAATEKARAIILFALRRLVESSGVDPLRDALCLLSDRQRLVGYLQGACTAGVPAPVELVGWLGLKEFTSQLEQIVLEGSPVAAAAAVWALAVMGCRGVAGACRQRLMGESEEDTRGALVRGLGEIGSEGDVPLIARSLHHRVGRMLERAQAVSALGRLGGAVAAEALVGFLREHQPQAFILGDKQEAIRELGRIAPDRVVAFEATFPSVSEWPSAYRETLAGVLSTVPGEGATESLIRLLGDSDHEVRAAAVRALARRSAPAAEEVLLRLANGTDEERLVAAKALRWIDTPAARCCLDRLQQDRLRDIRRAADGSCRRLDDWRQTDPLLQLLGGTDGLTAAAAVSALGSVGDEAALDGLQALVERHPGDPVVLLRARAAWDLIEKRAKKLQLEAKREAEKEQG